MNREIRIYRRPNGKSPLLQWLEKLEDPKICAVIESKILRLELGQFGDCKYLGNGVFEMRIHFSPGFRVYYGESGLNIIVLLCGGDKSSQKRDIVKAKFLWWESKQ